jgi:hypothetical protein
MRLRFSHGGVVYIKQALISLYTNQLQKRVDDISNKCSHFGYEGKVVLFLGKAPEYISEMIRLSLLNLMATYF